MKRNRKSVVQKIIERTEVFAGGAMAIIGASVLMVAFIGGFVYIVTALS
jgi:hypothetical protein